MRHEEPDDESKLRSGLGDDKEDMAYYCASLKAEDWALVGGHDLFLRPR